MTHADLPPTEAARLDAYARTMRTGMVALVFVAGMANLIPRTPGEFPAETVSEVRR